MRTIFISLMVMVLLFSNVSRAEAAELEVSGWIPYWSGSKGTTDAKKHLGVLDVIHPFSYTVKKDGGLNDLAGMTKSIWKRLLISAKGKDVLVVPTIMTSDTVGIHNILSNKDMREELIENIMDEVKKRKYDGIDIDFEGKRASTRPYFSLFLEELKDELGSKMLSCTIEARTPADSLYRVVPTTLEYANDFDAINEHCDRVNIMAYDQQRADIKVNDLRKGEPYIPVGDPAWIEKVMNLTMQSIDKDKLVLGIATYGAEWDLGVGPEQYKSYGKLWAVNPSYAEDIADDLNIEPYRNKARELSFTYLPEGIHIPKSYQAPKGTHEANVAAARALAYATATGTDTLVNIMWWSDAEAIQDKFELAEKLGIKGVALFKIDGGEDKDIWKFLK